MLYHWDTEAVADNLGASSVYIYINEMVMPVKYKGILIIIFWHIHSLSVDENKDIK